MKNAMTPAALHGLSGSSDRLPEARIERWQPLRGGLVDIFKYENQEFGYEQGRLILRGNNGTGKSRVLALQFPFLFDGEVAPHRLEPDGDPAKRIEWNLLMGRYPERTGYTWAEFGRRDRDGMEHYVTIGCGLRAVEGRGIADRWFFVTSKRIRRDLSLLTPERIVLGREGLGEALASEGRLFRDAKSYRAEVNRVLFGLDQRRYDALVDLLIQLRKPQLSRSLDEKGLSGALSEALTPTPADVIGPVAEAFRGLEEDRDALERYTIAARSVRAFMKEYRRYAGVASRRAAETVRQTHYQCETRLREMRAVEEKLALAESALAEVSAKVERLEQERTVARAELSTLESSPEKRQSEELDQARVRAEERAREAERAEERRERAASERDRTERECSAQADTEGATRNEVDKHLAMAVGHADITGLGTVHRTALDPLGLPGGSEALKALDNAHRRLTREVESRRAALHVLRKLQDKDRETRARLTQAQALLTDAQSMLAEAHAREADADEARSRAGEVLVTTFRAWCAGLCEMVLIDAEAVRDALEAWCASPEGCSPVETAVARSHEAAKSRLYEERARLRSLRDEAETRLSDLRIRYNEVAAGHHVPPAPPLARDAASRTSREGGPLWILCDFRPEVDAAMRAGIEAALETAGLLDAWVTPDGRLLSERAHDTVLAAGTSPKPKSGQDLGCWLVPSFDAAAPQLATMREATIEAVLRHVGAGPGTGHVWVSTDGRWQVGPLHGAWMKPAAEHIGQAAREVARKRRVVELAEEIERTEHERNHFEQELQALGEQEHRIDRERETRPDGDAVLRAHLEVQTARMAVIRCEDRSVQLEEQERARRAEADAASAERDALARDLAVPDPSMDLGPLVDALNKYEMALGQLSSAVKSHAEASRAAAAARDRHHSTVEADERAQRETALARDRACEANAIRDTLEATIGAAAYDVLRRLESARRRAKNIDQQHRNAMDERQEAAVSEAVVRSEIQNARDALASASEHRKTAVDEFARFLSTELAATASDALADIAADDWSVTRAVEVARRVDAELESIADDDGAWERSEKGIHRHVEELRSTLAPYDHEISVIVERGLWRVTALFGGKECSMREFERALTREVESRGALLTAKEREVIENHLSAEVALHLHKLIRGAEAWVRDVNTELDARPTSTGMRLRFAWVPLEEEVPGLGQARQRLLRTDGTWTPAERKALGEFLQQMIQIERQRHETGTWQEHLAVALDYRRWHRFVVERQQDKVWKPLTKKTHGTGSSGEKAIALTIPQFAAAAAHYRSAQATTPRLILLDEAFVGVDKRMRTQCMALLTAFDLDFTMTSENEWGCYSTVPGLAICQLATRPDVDAVGVTRWVWNGRTLERADPLPV